MDLAYDGTWGYHPLLVSLANTQERVGSLQCAGYAAFSPSGPADWSGVRTSTSLAASKVF